MKIERTIVWTCLALALGASAACGATDEVVVDGGWDWTCHAFREYAGLKP